MEEYARKRLSESVYPFVYDPQNFPHFCTKEESEEERSRSVLTVKGEVLFHISYLGRILHKPVQWKLAEALTVSIPCLAREGMDLLLSLVKVIKQSIKGKNQSDQLLEKRCSKAVDFCKAYQI